MILDRVDWQLLEGVRALANMLNMLYETSIACKVSIKRSAHPDSIGLIVDEQRFWIGLRYNDPEKLWFRTRCQIDPEAATRLMEGELTEEKWIPGCYSWRRGVELNSESVYFFSRSKVSQLRWLMSFLRECLDMARSIEKPDQPAIPEEPEES